MGVTSHSPGVIGAQATNTRGLVSLGLCHNYQVTRLLQSYFVHIIHALCSRLASKAWVPQKQPRLEGLEWEMHSHSPAAMRRSTEAATLQRHAMILMLGVAHNIENKTLTYMHSCLLPDLLMHPPALTIQVLATGWLVLGPVPIVSTGG